MFVTVLFVQEEKVKYLGCPALLHHYCCRNGRVVSCWLQKSVGDHFKQYLHFLINECFISNFHVWLQVVFNVTFGQLIFFFINFSKSAAPVIILHPLNDSLFLLSCCMIYPVLPSSINTLWNGENILGFFHFFLLEHESFLFAWGWIKSCGEDELLNVIAVLK